MRKQSWNETMKLPVMEFLTSYLYLKHKMEYEKRETDKILKR